MAEGVLNHGFGAIRFEEANENRQQAAAEGKVRSMASHGMFWRDPLSTPGDRFPLGPPPELWSGGRNDEPSEVGTRPFSLRGVVAVPMGDKGPSVTYSYDPVRQIGVVRGAGGEEIPLARHTKPGATNAETSGYPTDGDPKNPPPEEMHPPDYQED